MPKRTLVLIKPDGVVSCWTDDIKRRYEDAGFRIVYENRFQMTFNDAQQFYAEHQGKFFYSGLALSMSSGPSVVLILEGDNAVERVRKLNGATNPDKAERGTIRGDFRSAGGPFNTVHGSDSQESYVRELNLLKQFGVIRAPIAA